MPILSGSRGISEKVRFLAGFREKCKKRQFFANNSGTTQDRHIKLYIFEIRRKFRVEWYTTRCILKMFKEFLDLAGGHP